MLHCLLASNGYNKTMDGGFWQHNICSDRNVALGHWPWVTFVSSGTTNHMLPSYQVNYYKLYCKGPLNKGFR